MRDSIYKPTVADRKHCAKCQHRTYIGGLIGCLFIVDEGEPRGCKFGIGCKRFKKGPIINRSFIHTVIDPKVKAVRDKEHAARIAMIDYKGEALKRMRIKEK